MRRVDEALREVVSEVVTSGLADPRLGFVTVTDARTTADLRRAQVYVSVLGTTDEQQSSLAALRSAHGLIQATIARRLRMKRTPTLEFTLDDTAERAARVDAMLGAVELKASTEIGPAQQRAAVVAAIVAADRFCLVAHEQPDGDALGSLIAADRVLRARGKDTVIVIGPGDLPVPTEYSFLDTDGVITAPPADLADRTVIFLDCGNADRNAVSLDGHRHGPVLNVDHHHDNTRFGDINYVDAGASCTAEMVWQIARDLDVTITPECAEALYVGLVTDTGRFQYENTGATAHRMAADLVEIGVNPNVIFRRLYEGVPLAKQHLLARALTKLQQLDSGVVAFASLKRADFDAVGAIDSHSEGIIDHLRALKGAKVAALAREQGRRDDNGRHVKKVSVRSTDGEVDVSMIARASGGGGHRQAAGFATDLDDEQLIAFLIAQVAAQLNR